MRKAFLLAGTVLSLAYCEQAESAQRRTVAISELGSIFAQPNGFKYSDFGAVLATSTSGVLERLSPEAIKVVAARFHVFKPGDDKEWAYFPYSAFRRYEAQEVAAGRPPLFITAMHRGKRRPLLWEWSLDLKDRIPAAPDYQWRFAVNVQDERFIDFWIRTYVRGILLKDMGRLSNVWIGLDECAFNRGLYGVLDDAKRFSTDVQWDSRFPQNEDEYLASIQTFFRRLKVLAPDLRVMCNLGSLRDETRFPSVFADVPGIMLEDILDMNPSPSGRYTTYLSFRNYAWFGSQGRVAICRALVPATDSKRLEMAALVYLLIRGVNFFFAPQFDANTLAVPPERYTAILAALGNPTGPLRADARPGAADGYRFYSRTFEKGIIYMNWTGATRTVDVPRDRRYTDASGKPQTSITVPDLGITYVTVAGDGSNQAKRSRSPV